MAFEQTAAMSEGRRVYLGNLSYAVQPEEVEQMLQKEGYDIEKIHISIDPVSGRNPGYCFVDLVHVADAQRAIETLQTSMGNGKVKVGPCEPKKNKPRTRYEKAPESLMQRWGDWDNRRAADNGTQAKPQGPRQTTAHFEQVEPGDPMKTRLYIGGLDKMINQGEHNDEMREILDGLKPVAIGKRITPSERQRALPGNQHYCFVDFESAADADAAIEALHGKLHRGQPLKANYARAHSEQRSIMASRQTLSKENQGNTKEMRENAAARGDEIRNMASWR